MIIPPGIAASAIIPPGGGEPVGEYTFVFSGAEENLIVGAGISQAKFKIWGAGAGGGWYDPGRYGGGGGFTEVTFDVDAGDTITVQVAEGGQSHAYGPGDGGLAYGGGAKGGYPDGGDGAYGDTSGGGGGGSSRVWINEVLMAVAGGGGAAAGYVGWGGVGGGLTGSDSGVGFGRPGTQSGPGGGDTTGLASYKPDGCGEGGNYWENGANSPLVWANRTCQRGGYGGPQGGGTSGDGGGGGGGYYGGGGGGGDGRAGGGGSGFIEASGTDTDMISGLHDASVNSSDPDFPGGNISVGQQSRTGLKGGNGYIWVGLLA